MKFVIQSGNMFDFIFHVKEAIRFYEWYNQLTVNVLEIPISEIEVSLSYKDDFIPIGSVEFVHKVMQVQSGNNLYNPNQINIPQELLDFCFTKRKVIRVDDFLNNSHKPYFYKTDTVVKGESGILYPNDVLKSGKWIISEVIEDIYSEWRCFVLNNQLIDVRMYSGDFKYYPEIELIQNMIQKYNKKEPYTIDVGVSDIGTFVIEVHRFYSCGLYGFNDHNILLKMLIGTYNELKEMYNKNIEYGKN